MDSLVQQIIDVAGPAYDRAGGQRMRGVLDVYSVTKGKYYASWRVVEGTPVTATARTLEATLRRLVFLLSDNGSGEKGAT